MNLCLDCTESENVLTPPLFSVLILLKVWSEESEPYDDVDLILLMLEAVCALEGVRDGDMTLQSLVDRLRTMKNKSLATDFMDFVEESAKYLTSYMDLFESVLTYLVTNPPEGDENSKPPLLSSHPVSPMLGVFVIQCVNAYQYLTFSQVMRLHKQWAHTAARIDDWSSISLCKKVTEDKVKSYMEQEDYIPALRELILPSKRLLGGKEREERNLSSEALRVAALHNHFGHKEEGLRAVHEAIRLALHNNNTELLQHCLAWLHRLEPFSGEDATSVMKRLTTTSQGLHLPLLAGWGKLEESKVLLTLGRDPKQVLQVVLSGEASECVPVYSLKSEKLAHRGAMLATLAKIWEHYGFRNMSQLYCQLQCYMMSCTPLPTELEGRENSVICVSVIARHLLNTGDFGAASTLLQSAKTLLKSNGKSHKECGLVQLLCQCIEEVGFDWSIQTGDVITARRHLCRLQSLDKESALLRSAILNAEIENYTEAQRLALQLLKNCTPQHRMRALELLAEVHCVCGQPSLALPLLMDSLALSKAHHLPPYTTQLWLAHAQLQLGSPFTCSILASHCLLHFQTSGDVIHRGIAQLLLGQAALFMRHHQRGHLEKDDVVDVIPVLESVVADFQRTSATNHLHKATLLLGKTYETAGYGHQRDKMP